MKKPRILVIDDNRVLLETISMLLQKEGYEHETTTSPGEGIKWIRERDYDVVVSDLRMPEMTGLELIKMIKIFRPHVEVIFITGYGSIDSAVQAMSLGAFHYLPKPFNHEEFLIIIKRALAKRAMVLDYEYLKEQVDKRYSFDNIVGQNEQMQKTYDLIRKVGPSTAPVLIQGESGTGKELIARALHTCSLRSDKRFLAINTSSLPETLLESELFGYRKGAFTGAEQDKTGLLEAGNGGTVFLDEISSTSKNFQGKLLRVIQNGEITPVGDSTSIPVDVRFLSASNRNIKELVAENLFREDLYYRLNVIEISVPPLRERMDDLVLLAEYFLRKFCGEQGLPQKKFSQEVLKIFYGHDWPGNVRELENIIRRAVIVSDDRIIRAKDVVIRRVETFRASTLKNLYGMKYDKAKQIIQETFQKDYLRNLLTACKGNISIAADKAGISRQSLHKLIKKHGIEIKRRNVSQTQ